MITQQDLQAAIAECEGEKRPNANTCIKLAAFYTIKDHLYPQQDNKETPEPVIQAYRGGSYSEGYKYSSDSEFGGIVAEKGAENIMPIIDELMTTLSVLNPRLYAGVMRRLKDN